MQSLLFWKNWQKEFRFTWYLTGAIFTASLVFLWINYFQGIEGVIHWEKLQEQKIIETTVHSFQTGPFTLSVPAENYVIFEYFNGSDLIPDTVSSYYFGCILALASVFILAIITTLPRFWYLAGMTLFIIFLISLRLDVLGLFGLYNHVPVICLFLLLAGPSAYFNMIRPSASFVTRLIVFSLITLFTIIIIYLFSTVQAPLLHLTVTAYAAALVLTTLFILVVSHEILVSFVHISSQGGGTTGNFKHFALITAIYVFNLIVTCLHEIGAIEWNFVYINLYLLLSISAILGIWGFKARETLYDNIFPFHPYGAIFITILGALALATTGTLIANANDAALRVIRSIIITSHVGFTLIFFAYILSNFASMMWQRIPVDKILYKPNRMPYFTFQFAGLIATLAFIFYAGWRGYAYSSIGGFYTSLGDLHVTLDNKAFAQAHYDNARHNSFQNHHANYALAKLHSRRFDIEKARSHYNQANGDFASEFSLINAGNLYLWENDIFGAISAYHYAIRKFPSGRLYNNMGFAFGKVHNVDSSLFYLNKALETSSSKPSAEANFFALAADEYVPLKADSILKTFTATYTATTGNALALATLQHQEFYMPIDPLGKKHLDLYSATLLNNYIVRNTKTLDTLFIEKAYRIASDSLNEDYSESLKLALASAYYHQSNISKAVRIMAELAYISQSYQGKYNYILGLWALEQGNAALAHTYFSHAMTYDYKDARLYDAIALTEDGQLRDALTAWDSVAVSKHEEERLMAAHVKKILNTRLQEASTLPDAEKYQFCRYNLNVGDTTAFNQVINTFQDPNFKAMALFDMAKRQFDANHLKKSVYYLNKVDGLELTDETFYHTLHRFQLLLLAEKRDIRTLTDELAKATASESPQPLEKMLYTALINEASGDTLAAGNNFKLLAVYNPYFVEGVIAAARFYRSHSKDPLKAYTILAEAIQINNNSIKLFQEYILEATRMGFDNYAQSAQEQIDNLSTKQRRSLH